MEIRKPIFAESAGEEQIAYGDAAPPAFAPPAQEWPGNFEQRAFVLREMLDEPCTFADYRAAMRDMAFINRRTRGYRPAKKFLSRVVANRGVTHRPLHVMDLGCGHGDQLRAIHHCASRRSLPLQLTGVDLHPYAMRLAQEENRKAHVPAGTIEWLRSSLFREELPAADVLLSNLVAHHLTEEDVIRMLCVCAKARVGFLIVDLRRSKPAARMFRTMGWIFRLHKMVRHDGAVSFHRAFSVDEWREMIRKAGVKAEVENIGLGRVAISSICDGQVL